MSRTKDRLDDISDDPTEDLKNMSGTEEPQDHFMKQVERSENNKYKDCMDDDKC